MPSYFCLTIRFLQSFCHGRGGDGEPEWPPSPLRAFQALVAAAAARWNERMRLEYAVPALQWLETLECSAIIASAGLASDSPYLLYIPNNTADLLVPAWKQGDLGKGVKREQKPVRPTQLMGDAVSYLFSMPDGECPHVGVLSAAAQSITHLGWGVDMVVANAAVLSESDVAALAGEKWQRVEDSSATGYRVPVQGTVDNLIRKHEAFLNRLGPEGFKPVPPLSTYRVVGYRRGTDSLRRPVAAFELWKPIAQMANLPPGRSKFRPFDTTRQSATVAGMVRHAASEAARQAGWTHDKINSFVLGHGHGGDGQATTNNRLMYLPLPSKTPQRVESVRRVLVVAPSDSEVEIAKVRQTLSGQELFRFGEADAVAMLSVIPSADRNVQWYTRPASVWTTVSPVVLPGYDDPGHLRRRLRVVMDTDQRRRLLGRLEARIDGLIRKAIRQAGFSDELARYAQVEWRSTGFLPGVDLASRYAMPDHHKAASRYHVKIAWRDARGRPVRVPGPVVVGGGRFGGLGLFIATDG